MNDKEEANQKIWGGKFKEPPIEQEFTEIEYCLECGKKINKWMRKDGYWICPFCKVINGDFDIVYQCSLCLKESETEECNCYEN